MSVHVVRNGPVTTVIIVDESFFTVSITPSSSAACERATPRPIDERILPKLGVISDSWAATLSATAAEALRLLRLPSSRVAISPEALGAGSELPG